MDAFLDSAAAFSIFYHDATKSIRTFNSGTALLSLLCLVSCVPVWPADEPINLLKNPKFEATAANKPQSWDAFEGGYQFVAEGGRERTNAILLQRDDGEPARGIRQSIAINQQTAAPIVISGWSRAENVSGAADNDYSVYADVTYADDTTLWGQFAAFPTGTHDWQRAEFTIQPEKPVKSLTVYALLRNHTGKAWFSDLSVTTEGTGATTTNGLRNVLNNPKFADFKDGKPGDWEAFDAEFSGAAGGGPDGLNAIVMERGEGDKAHGIKQNVTLDQKTATPIVLSGWSKAEEVSGEPDNNYAVYADVTFQDGTNQWGVHAPFATGTHDWQKAEITFTPEKPIKALTFYALFREHTGKVWFSDLAVMASKPVAAQAPPVELVPVQAVKPFITNLYRATIPADEAVMRIVNETGTNLLANPHWIEVNKDDAAWKPWGEGYSLQRGKGREGRAAVFVERKQSDGERGIMQEIVLNQKQAVPLRLTGWSRAEDVAGAADSDYSLYSDVTYEDGTNLWGLASEFRTGTHGWEKAEVFIDPEKPIKSVTVYALFRNHTGRAWFSDLSLSAVTAPAGAALFDGLAVRPITQSSTSRKAPMTYQTADGLALSLRPGSWQVASLRLDGRELSAAATPSGFLVRDVANESGFFGFENGTNKPLQLNLSAKIENADDHIAISGRLSDLTGKDRAVSLVFALPIDATRGWTWGKDIRTELPVENSEYSTTAPFFAGANGRISIYPFGSISQRQGAGVALALDMNHAAQYRIAYIGATRQFYIIYDFGLAPEKPAADFRFVLYRIDGRAGFRSAAAGLYKIFPSMFQVREPVRKQGLWMPFTDIRRIEGWEDFGFRFREGGAEAVSDSSLKFDDENGILTFRYSEPMTWWMPMSATTPRTYEVALAQLQRIASTPGDAAQASAQAVLSSGFRDESGRYIVQFRDSPWSNGAVWSINPNPNLTGKTTGADLLWNEEIKKTVYEANPAGTMDGEYLDSLEGYVTANLDFDRAHWKKAIAPLTFATGSRFPAQHKALLAYEFTRWMSNQLHGMNKLVFANSVPYRFAFLTPWLDVMGTEANWLPGGKWQPDADSLMNLRRTLSAGKPYLLLQNTDYNQFTPNYVEKYMQRALFYGIFPGFFSEDAATSPYWLNPAWYNRDRPIFKKYIPIIRQVAEAGWQPLPLASSSNADIWIERYGTGKSQYLTIRNNSETAQNAQIVLDRALHNFTSATDLVTQTRLSLKTGTLVVKLAPDQTMAVHLN